MGTVRKNRATILLVDDEETERTRAQNFLHCESFKVVVVDSYSNALRAFERNRAVDLLIADIALPDGNGCELALQMREDKPDLRVLFVSGDVGAEVFRYYGLDVTDLHFLRKPFQLQALVNAVQRVLSDVAIPFPRMVPKTRTA